MKICARCEQEKSNDDFKTNDRYNDGLNPYCIQCVSEYNRNYRKEVRGPEIQFSCSHKNKFELENLLSHLGIEPHVFWKMKLREILDQYPPHYRVNKKAG